MSRIGRKPVPVPSGVDVQISPENVVVVKGPQGALTSTLHRDMALVREDGTILVNRPDDKREHRALHGLTRSLLNNMIVGVTEGYRKNLEIQGVGYRAAMDGQTLVLNVGYSHQVRLEAPP